jgi:hypothetical protein
MNFPMGGRLTVVNQFILVRYLVIVQEITNGIVIQI